MSKRSPSERQFYTTAIEVRTEVTRLMSRRSAVPKAYVFTVANPTIADAKRLVDDVARSEEFYPSNPHNVLWRKHYLTLAVADCKSVLQDLQTAKDIGLPINLNALDSLVGALDREIGLLKSARKSVRLAGRETMEMRAARLEEELADARGALQ